MQNGMTETPMHPSVQLAFDKLMQAADWANTYDSEEERVANSQNFVIPAYRLRDWYFTQLAMRETALAEREAQVRAEEREAAKGLVEAINAIELARTSQQLGSINSITNMVEKIKGAVALAATYNDNRKG